MFVVQSSETVMTQRSSITGQLLITTTDKLESTYQSQTTVCLCVYFTRLHILNLHLFALRRSTCWSVAVEIVVKSCQQNSCLINRGSESKALAGIHPNMVLKWLQVCCWSGWIEKENQSHTFGVCVHNFCTMSHVYTLYLKYRYLWTSFSQRLLKTMSTNSLWDLESLWIHCFPSPSPRSPCWQLPICHVWMLQTWWQMPIQSACAKEIDR